MKKIILLLMLGCFVIHMPSAFAGLKIDKTKDRYAEFMPVDSLETSLKLRRLLKLKDKGLTFERAKIDFLLEAISKSGFEYDRNRVNYNAKQTVDHLRKKYRKKFREIRTAEDFIRKIATRSEATGRRYLAIPGNGYSYYTSDLLYFKLEQLENFLNQNIEFKE